MVGQTTSKQQFTMWIYPAEIFPDGAHIILRSSKRKTGEIYGFEVKINKYITQRQKKVVDMIN